MADPVHDETVRVGLLGCGHVGSALVRLLQENAELIEQRAGVHLEVTRVAVRDPGRERDVPIPASRFTQDGEAVVTDPDIDIVVEVIGGIEPARSLITEALDSAEPDRRCIDEHFHRKAPGGYSISPPRCHGV